MHQAAHDCEPVAFISLDDLKAVGADLTITELLSAMETAWRDIRAGKSFGGKAVLSLPEEDFWEMPAFRAFRAGFADQRLGWKLSSLYSVNPDCAAVKIIGANAFNRELGLPRSTSTIVLLEKMSMRPLAVLDGTTISARRTGTYASTVFQRCFAQVGSISVFVFGAGPVARSVIACLDAVGGDRIREIFVRGRTIESAISTTESLRPETAVRLIPVPDNQRLGDCAFVVTASNARRPVFADGDLSANAVTLHLGGDELPEAYLTRALRTGTVVCDSIAMVSHRASQSLALHFLRKGSSLEAVGPLLGVEELSAPKDWYPQHPGPLCVTCVGLPMLDLYAAQATFEKYVKARELLRAAR